MSHVTEHTFIFCRATNDRICRESPVACRLSRVTEHGFSYDNNSCHIILSYHCVRSLIAGRPFGPVPGFYSCWCLGGCGAGFMVFGCRSVFGGGWVWCGLFGCWVGWVVVVCYSCCFPWCFFVLGGGGGGGCC